MNEPRPDRSLPANWGAPGVNQQEEFLFHFNRGGDLLRRGREDEARFHLEQAARLAPDNAQCRNLLGLLAFRQGRLEEAISIYDGLLERYPGDESLSVNLATALIKLGQVERAELLLSAVLQQNPSHQRAAAMLQALHRQDGEEPARDSPAPLSGEPAAKPGPAGWPEPFRKPYEPVAADGASQQQVTAVARAGPFVVEAGGLLVEGSASFCCRLEHLALVEGEPEYQTLRKRYQGQDTKWLFGSGPRVMCRVQGLRRAFFLPPPGGGYQVVELAAEDGFWREERVVAFAGERQWENGRLMIGQGGGMDVFHLAGPAALVLDSHRARWFALDPGQPLRVRMASLVGWRGELEPSLLQQQAGDEDTWVLFQGRGAVLLGNP